jgi:hypothetical protein
LKWLVEGLRASGTKYTWESRELKEMLSIMGWLIQFILWQFG